MTSENTTKLEGEKKCWLYWIHLPGVHTDIATQGYLGIATRGVAKRYMCHKSHAKSGKKTHLYDAMRKYGDAVEVKTLLIGTLDYCLDLELKLRSTLDLGWNTGIGGEKPTVGYRHSVESKKLISEASASRTRSIETRAKIGAAHKGKVVSQATRDKSSASRKAKAHPPWMNPAANEAVWAIAGDIAEYATNNPTDGIYLVSKNFGLTMSKVHKITNKARAGWNPSTDEAYQLWLSQYKQKECNESTLTA